MVPLCTLEREQDTQQHSTELQPQVMLTWQTYLCEQVLIGMLEMRMGSHQRIEQVSYLAPIGAFCP